MRKFLKSITDFAGKIFHDRRIVIVSEGKASTIAISRNLQIAVAVVVLLGICLLPFSAGRIVAVSNNLGTKSFVTGAAGSMEQRVEVLQNDILLLEEYLRALHKYDNFDIYKKDGGSEPQRSDSGNASDAVSELEQKRDDIMINLKKRTLVRIISIENFLKSAGLNYAQITGKQHSGIMGLAGENAGGPYIPLNINDVANMEQDKYITPEFIDQLNYLYELQQIVNDLPFSNPVAYKKVSSYYGVRHDPFNGTLSMHAGMDLQGDHGSQVASTGPGKVDFAGWKGAYGNMVEIDHGYGFKTRYGHLSQIIVKEGDDITRGQIVGVQGCTGRCTGEHVHYEVRINDVPVNPMTYLIKAREIQYYYDKKL